MPQIFIPEAFILRDSLNRDMKQWHALARELFKESDVDENGDGRSLVGFWKYLRDWKILYAVHNWDYDAVATSDFGLLWL